MSEPIKPVEIRTGPDYLDPHKLIKETHRVADSAALEGNLKRILQGGDPTQKMDAFVNSLWGNFQHNMNADTRLTVSQFSRYELLYSRDAQKQVIDGTASSELLEQINTLSEEFYRLVNVQKPIHIVDDNTGEEVCPPLPPIFNSLRTLTGKGSEAVDIFQQAFARSDGVNGGVGEQHVAKAAKNLMQLIVMSQDRETLMERISETDELANNFHAQVFGKPVFEDMKTTTETPEQGSTVDQSNNSDDLFDFDPIG